MPGYPSEPAVLLTAMPAVAQSTASDPAIATLAIGDAAPDFCLPESTAARIRSPTFALRPC